VISTGFDGQTVDNMGDCTILSRACKFLLVFLCNYICVLQLLGYSTSNNGMLLQSKLWLIPGHWKWQHLIDRTRVPVGLRKYQRTF